MMSWYNIIPYYIPNNKWTIPMLNMMSSESWQSPNSRRKCRKSCLHKKGMRKHIEHLYAFKKTFPTFIYYGPNILNPSKLIHEVEEAKCNGTTKEKHAEKPQNLRGGKQDTPNVEAEDQAHKVS
jgi:hypothetical protein